MPLFQPAPRYMHRGAGTRSLLCLALFAGVARLSAQQPLETETARLPARHEVVIGASYEFQTSSQGTEHAVPLALEYGVTNRIALLIEPVLYTAIRPASGRAATGVGDLEATAQFLVANETAHVPAMALAAEVKFPTARNRAIGTGRTDFTPYLIASKRLGRFDAHANVGCSFVGKPSDLSVQNTLNLAFAVENHVTRGIDILAEVLSTTASLSGGEGTVDPNAPELAGAEQVGMIGIRLRHGPRTWFSLGVTYDNTNALLFRPGFTLGLP